MPRLFVEHAADMLQNPDRRLDVLIGEAGQGVAADAASHRLDLVGDGVSARCQHNGLGAAVLAFLALDEAGSLEIVQQAHDRRAVERHRGRKILLPRRGGRAGDMNQRQPGRLGELEGLRRRSAARRHWRAARDSREPKESRFDERRAAMRIH